MDYSKVPQDLKALPRWGLFKKEWNARRGKYNKFPVNALTGKDAKSNDESTWTTFDKAVAHLDEYGAAGLAFFLKPPYILLDVDHVFDEIKATVGGDQENIVADFMNHTNSYTETSVSGEGIHIIVKGHLPGDRKRHANVEMYTEKRFVALTGNVFGPIVDHVNTADDDDLAYLYHTYISKQDRVIPLGGTAPIGTSQLTAEQVVEKALASAQGPKFKRFLDGDWQSLGYSSQSEADQGFANMLAFWCAKDKSLMDEVFRQSKMYRPKWDEKRGKGTYADLTLNEAINRTVNTYQPEPDFHIYVKDWSSTLDQIDPLLRPKPYTDTGLRNRFLQKHINDVKYSAERKRFLYFDGHKWDYDVTAQVPKMLDQVIHDIKDEPVVVADSNDTDAVKEANKKKEKFIAHCESNAGKNAALNEIARWVMVTDDAFDSETGVINTPDGVVNLSSGEIRKTNYKDLFTKSTNAGVGEYATPMFDRFMAQIFPDHPELAQFVMRLMGYTLLGTMAEQKTIILFGTGGKKNGANGKSTLMELFRDIFGDYAVSLDPEIVTYTKAHFHDSSADSQLAATKGSRLMVTSELERGAMLSEATIKRMSGGETITARRLYEQPIEFKPTGTLWMTTNYMPTISGTDNGIWRRIITIPMTAQITERDPHLLDKLLTERDGILHKAIQGALDYQKNGLQVPEICEEAKAEYQQDMDTVGQFLADTMIVTGSDDDQITNKQLYQTYDDWNDVYKLNLSHNGLSKELQQRGFKKWRNMYGRGICGLKIKKSINRFSNIPDIS